MLQEIPPEYRRYILHAQRGAGMAGVGLLHGIDTQKAYGIGERLLFHGIPLLVDRRLHASLRDAVVYRQKNTTNGSGTY